MRTNGQRRPEEIEADIERTRSELNDTLSAIERRFSPGELVDQGLAYLRRSGAREYADNLGAAARQDPVPMALVGIGLAWLMMSSRRGSYDAAHRAAAADRGLSAAGMRQKVSATTQRMSDTAHAARERMHHMGDSARHGAQRLRDGYDHMAQEQPLVLGAIGLALGALLGASAPRTRTEERWMGSASDRATAAFEDTTRAAGDGLASASPAPYTASPGAGAAGSLHQPHVPPPTL